MSKESFLIYKSFYEPIKDLPNEQLGELFRAIYLYQITGEEPQPTSIIFMPFQFFKNQFRLDGIKYEKVVNRNKSNGSNGGRPKTQNNPKNPVGFTEPKKPDNDNEKDNDNVNVNDNDNVKEKVNNIEERKLKFADTLKPFLPTYGKDMLNDFYKYWTEHNKSNSKFKQETEKTWSVERRLETWAKNENKFAGKKELPSPTKDVPDGYYRNTQGDLIKIQKDEW